MRSLLAFLITAGVTTAAIPHKEQLAPGVWAAGFADKYGDATAVGSPPNPMPF